MQAILNVLSPIFWGVILLSSLVFIHEGGHFLAARACGVRVSEFFLGMPCRFQISRRSKRFGTKFGITPILLGGYAAICGMEHDSNPSAARVLEYIHAHGSAKVAAMAEELGLEEEEALNSCIMLMSWGSISGIYDESDPKAHSYYPTEYAAAPRDKAGNTLLDGRKFNRQEATKEGECWALPMDADAFLAQEKSRTYEGMGFWRRTFILLAGIIVNILAGILLLMSVYSVIGFDVVSDVNVVSAVSEDSPAESIGMQAGDQITELYGTQTDTWTDITEALQAAQDDGVDTVDITYVHEGSKHSCEVELTDEGKLGIQASTELYRFSLADSAKLSIAYIQQTAAGIVQLLNPTHTVEVLNQSTSVVGISVMSAQYAAAGPAAFLYFAALISLSLGFMNLLPIPPLDGGKLLIEIIQAVRRKNVSARVQNIISYVGVGLFLILFVYMLRADIIRFFL